MAKANISVFSVDEMDYIMNYLKDNIGPYALSSILENAVGDVPSINGAHPLSMEYGAMLSGDGQNYTSQLPAIGVELLDDSEQVPQLLGQGFNVVQITDAFVDELEADAKAINRFRHGMLASNATVQAVRAMLTVKGAEKLWARKERWIQQETISVSIWSFHIDVTRVLYQTVKALLKRLKRPLSAIGMKNVSIKGQMGLYSYDFQQTAYGGEFTMSLQAPFIDLEVDDTIGTIKEIKEAEVGAGKSVTFKNIGG